MFLLLQLTPFFPPSSHTWQATRPQSSPDQGLFLTRMSFNGVPVFSINLILRPHMSTYSASLLLRLLRSFPPGVLSTQNTAVGCWLYLGRGNMGLVTRGVLGADCGVSWEIFVVGVGGLEVIGEDHLQAVWDSSN